MSKLLDRAEQQLAKLRRRLDPPVIDPAPTVPEWMQCALSRRDELLGRIRCQIDSNEAKRAELEASAANVAEPTPAQAIDVYAGLPCMRPHVQPRERTLAGMRAVASLRQAMDRLEDLDEAQPDEAEHVFVLLEMFVHSRRAFRSS